MKLIDHYKQLIKLKEELNLQKRKFNDNHLNQFNYNRFIRQYKNLNFFKIWVLSSLKHKIIP